MQILAEIEQKIAYTMLATSINTVNSSSTLKVVFRMDYLNL